MTGSIDGAHRAGDVTASAVLNGTRFTARIEQFRDAAYISIWGGGTDHDANIDTPDVRRELAEALRDSCNLHPQTVAVLKMVATVFGEAELAGGPPLADAFHTVVYDGRS